MDLMPNAPQPVYDSHGNPVSEWKCSIGYSPTEDRITVWWSQGEGPFHSAKQGTETVSYEDVEEALEVVLRRVRIMSARRLF